MSALSIAAAEWKPGGRDTDTGGGFAEDIRTTVYVAIDVECVATGVEADRRAVALVAAVNAAGETIFFEHVKPDAQVRSYLTPLTGICEADLVSARSLADVVGSLRNLLQSMAPAEVVIVGHSVSSDIGWLGLREGHDFARAEDTAKIFAVKGQNGRRVFFSLRHICIHLLGYDPQRGVHSPDVDARVAMELFQTFGLGMADAQLESHRQRLLRAPRTLPFASHTPYLDGCALSSKSPIYLARLEKNNLQLPSAAYGAMKNENSAPLVHQAVIFLDIDGVLNRTKHATEIHLEESKCALLMELVRSVEQKNIKVKIVLSTFWRTFRKYIEYILQRRGFPPGIVCGVTPGDPVSKKSYVNRAEEIETWLANANVINFVILDDRESASNEKLQPRFVRTQHETGLTHENVLDAVRILTT